MGEKGASAITATPTDDQPGFVAEEAEYCFACFRLIRPGQIYYLTIEHEVLCADCALDEGAIRMKEDLAVEVKHDRLVIQRGRSEVEVFPHGIRHLVNALVEAAVRQSRDRCGDRIGRWAVVCRMRG